MNEKFGLDYNFRYPIYKLLRRHFTYNEPFDVSEEYEKSIKRYDNIPNSLKLLIENITEPLDIDYELLMCPVGIESEFIFTTRYGKTYDNVVCILGYICFLLEEDLITFKLAWGNTLTIERTVVVN